MLAEKGTIQSAAVDIRAPPTRRLDERARAAEEEEKEPVGELTALCGESGSVL